VLAYSLVAAQQAASVKELCSMSQILYFPLQANIFVSFVVQNLEKFQKVHNLNSRLECYHMPNVDLTKY
jgi:hypothetical protein